MAEELIRAACEAANCKYPDMEAMANFKREVTPSAVIGLLDGLRHAKGVAAINDARANGAAETIQHLRAENSALRAQAQAAPEAEPVEVVAWRHCGDKTRLLCDLGKQRAIPGTIADEFTVPLMEVAQHNRIMASAQQNDAELVELLRETVEDRSGAIHFMGTDLPDRIDAKLATLSAKPAAGGCGSKLAPGQYFRFCGETDMGQSMPALCEQCGGSFKLECP